MPARADAIATYGGHENISATLSFLDAIDPSIMYLGSYRRAGPDAVSTPGGEIISGTGKASGTISSNADTIIFYDVQAGPHSDLIQLSTPAATAGWTTDWRNLLSGHGKVRKASNLAGFGEKMPTSVPEPSSVAVLGAGLLGLGLIRRPPRH